MSIYRRVLLYYRPFVGSTLLALTISLATIGLNLLKPVPFALIVDHVLPDRDRHRAAGGGWASKPC